MGVPARRPGRTPQSPHHRPHLFADARPVDLSQHNYTLFLNLLAMPLMGWLGTVATFNVVYLLSVVLTAWVTFVLARRVTEAPRPKPGWPVWSSRGRR